MRVPLGWLREYVDLPAAAGDVAEMLAQIGFPVEAIEERPIITGVVAGRIQVLEKHPNADRLQVGKIDVGNGALLTIATAATNVAQGQTIPVATIGAQLPHLRIERRKMRGVESEGMMISADELALPPEWFEDGIMQLEAGIAPGTDVVEAFRLSEAVLDVEVTSNRVDAMSVLGLARELAAFQGAALRVPSMEYPVAADEHAPSVTIETPDCKRFVAQRFSGIRIGISPAWMRMRLALAGQRPINNIVDISNYVMLETGQPLHFYDDARVRNRHFIVRDARPNEKLLTLDGVEHELSPQALVIADEGEALGLAGLKGGRSSEVTDDTTAILLESANFTGSRVRRTSFELGFRTDASTRHEKSLPPALTDLGARRAAHLLTQQGALAHPPHTFGQDARAAEPIPFNPADVRRLLGLELSQTEMREYLDRLGFAVESGGPGMLVTPPEWRSDVKLAADLVEEIARMAGYDRIESTVPAVAPHGVESTAYELETQIAHTLEALGYVEIATYALQGAQGAQRYERAGIAPPARAIEVRNPLSEDQRYLRTSLVPAMLEHFARIDAPVRAFEIGHVFFDEGGVPAEQAALTFGMTVEPANDPPWRDTSFLRLKGDAETLLARTTGIREIESEQAVLDGWHPGKAAILIVDGREVATVGAVDPRLCNAFEVRLPAYVATIFLDRIPAYRVSRYAPPSKYPSTYRDLALLCNVGVSASAVQRTIADALGQLCTGVRAFDEYRGPQVAADKKSLAVRVTLQKQDGTITDEEADRAIDLALERLRDELGVTLRA